MKCSLVFLGLFAVTAIAGQHNLILKFDQPVDIAATLASYDLVFHRQLNSEPIYQVKIQSELSRQALLNDIDTLPSVLTAEENQVTSLGELEGAASVDSRLIFVLDDIDSRLIFVLDSEGSETMRLSALSYPEQQDFAPLYQQYHIPMTRTDSAWPHASGEGVVVAVLDTGVDQDHPFLAGSLVPGYDFVDNDADPEDVRTGLDSNGNGVLDEGWGHGTHVAGLVKTVAPRAQIMPIRVADSDGHVDLFDLVQGISYALMNGADIINMSLSVDDPSPLLQEWLELAKWVNVVVVTSAGNDNHSDLKFPSTESEVLTVTAVGPDYTKTNFANYSKMVDVSAPGDMLASAHPGGYYLYRSGTSMSAPIVAGQAAIILDLAPGSSVEYVTHRIKNKSYDINAYNPDYRNKMGKGLADIWNSITLQNQ